MFEYQLQKAESRRKKKERKKTVQEIQWQIAPRII